jgi:hypothetical protein
MAIFASFKLRVHGSGLLKVGCAYTQVEAEAQAITTALVDCLLRVGFACNLGKHMTPGKSSKAHQRVPVLHKLSAETQEYDTDSKQNVERFVWEFLANRSFTGEPHSVQKGDGKGVSCNQKSKCPDSEVWNKM